MKYKAVRKAIFLRRPNRFIAYVDLNGEEIIVHVKNTGRCRELLIPGALVVLEDAGHPGRKTQYSLIAVYKGTVLVNMDSQAPNQLVGEGLAAGEIREIGQVNSLRREVGFGESRFDWWFERDGRQGFVEVKGVTLEEEGVALFPDAPTLRGAKHLRELQRAVREGWLGYVIFVVQMQGITCFRPNEKMDGDFAVALREASSAGVRVMAYDAIIMEDGMTWGKEIPVELV